MQYNFVCYAYESNAIIVRPMKSRDNADMVGAYKEIYEYLEAKGFKPKLNIRCPINAANETNDTDSEDESTEGDCMNVGKNPFLSLFYLHDCLIASSIHFIL